MVCLLLQTKFFLCTEKHPELYLTSEQKEKLDSLVLLDPSWLTEMMRNVMELQTGKGSKLANYEILEVEKTGCAKLSLLRKCCWNELNDDDFANLILMLQSFCLIFPLPSSEAPPSFGSSSTSILSTQDKAHAHHSQSEEQTSLMLDTLYLIPSKLHTDVDQPCGNYKFSFVFDFGGFLPEQVYHRLLCLMLKRQSETVGFKLKGEFTAQYFKIKGVEKCNWMIQKIKSKLCVSVLYSQR